MAEGENPFAALSNPAVIPSQAKPQFGFSTGIAGSSLKPSGTGLVDSPKFRTERGVTRTEPLEARNTRLGVWAVGLAYPFGLPSLMSRQAGFGLAISGPYERLRTFRSGTPYDFSSLRYGTSDGQFKATLSGAVELWPEHLSLGAGVSVFLSTAGAADATFVSDNPTGRLALDVGLNTAAIVGLHSREGRTSAGLVYRQEIRPTFQQKIDGKVQLGGVDTLSQPILMQSTMYFEPAAFEGDIQHDFEWVKASAGLAYQRWSNYQPSYLVMSGPDADGGTRTTRVPDIQIRDTWNPRASLDFPLVESTLFLSTGYQYRPSPLRDLSGNHNILDGNTHVAGASLRHRLQDTWWFPHAVTWAIYGQYHWIAARDVVKNDPDFIGAPGYRLSGNAYTYGVALQTEL